MNFLDLYPRGEGLAGASKGALIVLGVVGVDVLSGVACSQIGITSIWAASNLSALSLLRAAMDSLLTPNLIAMLLSVSFSCAL